MTIKVKCLYCNKLVTMKKVVKRWKGEGVEELLKCPKCGVEVDPSDVATWEDK